VPNYSPCAKLRSVLVNKKKCVYICIYVYVRGVKINDSFHIHKETCGFRTEIITCPERKLDFKTDSPMF
jgi:hypothetical protein